MIIGLFISEKGEVQAIGDITNWQTIISSIKAVLPQLEQEYNKKLIESLSEEDLVRALAQKKAKLVETSE